MPFIMKKVNKKKAAINNIKYISCIFFPRQYIYTYGKVKIVLRNEKSLSSKPVIRKDRQGKKSVNPA